MFANDFSFILYGGYQPFSANAPAPPPPTQFSVYEEFLQGPARTWVAGYTNMDIDAASNTNVYVGSGAGVNVRELNMSYYFSGLHSETWGLIKGPGVTIDPWIANVTSHQLISVDMSSQLSPVWKNVTTPATARPRVNPEMVFVPVGDNGVLIVVGGVLWPDWMTDSTGASPNATETTQSVSLPFTSRST